MKKSFLILIVFCILLSATNGYAKKKKVDVRGGAMVPRMGIMIDASYDSRLDNLVPGYKVVNVAIVNQSLNVVPLNPTKDKWWVKIAGLSGLKKVVFNLREQKPKLWAELPQRARGLVAYPLMLPVGARQVIDIFVPEKYDLANLTEINIFFKSFGTQINVQISQ